MIFKNILLFWAITFHRMEFLLAPCSGLFHRPNLNVLLEGQGISIFEDSQIQKKLAHIFVNFEELGVNFSVWQGNESQFCLKYPQLVRKTKDYARIPQRTTTVHLSNRRQIRKLKTQQCIAIYFGIICTIFSLQVESPFPWFITFVCLTAVESIKWV